MIYFTFHSEPTFCDLGHFLVCRYTVCQIFVNIDIFRLAGNLLHYILSVYNIQHFLCNMNHLASFIRQHPTFSFNIITGSLTIPPPKKTFILNRDHASHVSCSYASCIVWISIICIMHFILHALLLNLFILRNNYYFESTSQKIYADNFKAAGLDRLTNSSN